MGSISEVALVMRTAVPRNLWPILESAWTKLNSRRQGRSDSNHVLRNHRREDRQDRPIGYNHEGHEDELRCRRVHEEGVQNGLIAVHDLEEDEKRVEKALEPASLTFLALIVFLFATMAWRWILKKEGN